MEEYYYKKLDSENIKDLVPIYKLAFNKEVSEEYLIKKNSTEAFGLSFTGFIAYHIQTNEAAAFYGVFPCLIKYEDQIIRAAQSGDTMTHPKHQGKGLFIKLAKMTYDYVKENGVQCVFGFPNKNSYPGFVRKLDWEHIEDMQAWLVRVKCLSWARCKKMFHLPDSLFWLNTRFVLALCKKGKVPFQNSVISEDIAGIERNADFFKYKTYEKNYVISVKGKSVWIKPDTSFFKIGDMEHCTEREFRAIVRRLKILAFFMGLPYLRYHCSPGTYFEKMFAEHGRKHDATFPVGWVNFNSPFKLEQLKFTMCDNDTF
ncbi:MAG: GNAT family N-acetyltransferase [Bacteroidota bacterium]